MRSRDRAAVIAIGLATLALRLFHIRERPIFNDEAIFIRWAQLVHDSPSRLFEITLEDPKPPLHPALLALFIRIGHDPVLTGRVISAVAGMLTVLAFAAVAYELEKRSDAAVIAAILGAGSPFFAFHQRLATADALFVLESLIAVWFTLRGSALLAGTALGAALETRSVFSLSLAAILFGKARKRFALAAIAALCLWLPYLLARRDKYRPSLFGELRRRIFYQSPFHATVPSLHAFNWLWTYLTPPVLIAAVVALVFKRHWFLALWTVAMLVPVIFGSVTYSRYALNAALPLVLAATSLIALMPRRFLACGVIAAFPLFLTIRGATDWRQERLVASDRYQYNEGWPAGFATEQAIAWLERRAAAGPIVIATSDEWGLPADAVRLHFDRDPRVTMSATRASNAYAITRGRIGEQLPPGTVIFRNPGHAGDTVIVLPPQSARSSR
jgi:hypothetical protein